MKSGVAIEALTFAMSLVYSELLAAAIQKAYLGSRRTSGESLVEIITLDIFFVKAVDSSFPTPF